MVRPPLKLLIVFSVLLMSWGSHVCCCTQANAGKDTNGESHSCIKRAQLCPEKF